MIQPLPVAYSDPIQNEASKRGVKVSTVSDKEKKKQREEKKKSDAKFEKMEKDREKEKEKVDPKNLEKNKPKLLELNISSPYTSSSSFKSSFIPPSLLMNRVNVKLRYQSEKGIIIFL
jgi:hypothetical protein